MKTETKIGALLTIALMAALLLALPAMAETNESVTMVTLEVDETVNVSMNMLPDEETLYFPREDNTIFTECGYLIWETDYSIGNDYRISVGLIPAGVEVDPSSAVWITIRESASSDPMGSYYIWYPPSGMADNGKYNAIVLVDYEVAGTEREGTYYQETLCTEGPFNLVNLPPAP